MPELQALLSAFVIHKLSDQQIRQLQLYLDLLLKWNAKISLTSIRDPEQIVRRHFGESLFAGEQLGIQSPSTLFDLGSGAGFPGLPIKILFPELEITLIESQQKKAAFLREVIRSLGLNRARVHAGRAEALQAKAQIVTMRAVEKFDSVLPTAAYLVAPQGRLALLIGGGQVEKACDALPDFKWNAPRAIPESRERVLLVGQKATN